MCSAFYIEIIICVLGKYDYASPFLIYYHTIFLTRAYFFLGFLLNQYCLQPNIYCLLFLDSLSKIPLLKILCIEVCYGYS